MGRDEVCALVLDRIAEVLGGRSEDLTPSIRLRDDLGADDLTLLDLVELLEDELGERTVGFRLDDDDLSEIDTVGDLVDVVVAMLGLPLAGCITLVPRVEVADTLPP